MGKSKSIGKPNRILLYCKSKKRSISIPHEKQSLTQINESNFGTLFKSLIDNRTYTPVYPECLIISQGNAKNSNQKTFLGENKIISMPNFSIFFNCNIFSKAINDRSNPMYKYLTFSTPSSTTIQSNTTGSISIKCHGKGKAISKATTNNPIIFDNDIEQKVMQSEVPLVSMFTATEVSFVSVDINNKPRIFDSINFSSTKIMVEDNNPPSGLSGSSSSNGAGMKSLKLTIQKNAYIEQLLSFNDKVVKDISGLPSGIVFTKKYLKGSPTISGKYNILIKFSDNSCIPGIIIVTQMHRKL